jgi:hypothetical protein
LWQYEAALKRWNFANLQFMNTQRILIGVSVVLALVCAFLAYQIVQKNDTINTQQENEAQLTLERNQLVFDLEKMRFSYDTLQVENDLMLAEIEDQQAKIDDLVNRVKNLNWSLSRANKEKETLRTIMQGYLVTIDSLNQLNLALQGENEAMRQQVATVEDRNRALRERQENMEEIISTGRILKAAEVDVQAIRILDSGRQRETDRASRADMIRVCFTLLENRIAEAGRKNLYLQITGENGVVLKPADDLPAQNAAGAAISASRSIEYANDRLEACIFYSPESPFEVGTFKVEVLEENEVIGEGQIALR